MFKIILYNSIEVFQPLVAAQQRHTNKSSISSLCKSELMELFAMCNKKEGIVTS